MPDIAGDVSTTSTLFVGGTVTGSLETVLDHDWYRITLTAGQTITIGMIGTGVSPLEDPFLIMRDAFGNNLAENDDGGAGRNSLLTFRAPTTGTYYIDAGAWEPDTPYPEYTGIGDFQINVTTWNPPPVWNNDQIANQLVNGYWEGDSHHFNVTQGGMITVNLTGLNAAGMFYARNALQMWSDVIGITFQEVASGGQILFDDTGGSEGDSASTQAYYSGGIISSAEIDIAASWIVDDGMNLNSYSFQTYLHEIGHALGLGHAGNYNVTADYPFDALFENDGWSASLMSYFSPLDNSFYQARSFSYVYDVTPMAADVLAISQLYGLSTTTRTGNTVYGFNSTAGRAEFDAQQFTGVAYTVFDSGGIDTLDYSGFSSIQRIDLNSETFSNVGGRTGNVSIARGTVIENAIGGSSIDTIIGNAADNVLTGNAGADVLNGNGGADTLRGGAGNDNLTGGAGSDTFLGTTAELNGDTLVDFTTGDRIVISNATLAGFTFSVLGSTLSFSGVSLTLGTALTGTLTATAAASGGVQLSLVTVVAPIPDVFHDFNGDGRSDILWRNDAGGFSNWLGQANGGFTGNDANAFSNVPTSWTIAGTGDFNGDGKDDVLWRSNTGQLSDWLGKANGGFTTNDANALVNVPTSWNVVGTGDFNGDGKDDILWRSNTGQLSDWLGTASGGFTPNDGNAFANVPTSWNVVGTGDFNGDGKDDILWRSNTGQLSDWLGTASGGFTQNDGNALRSVPTNWHVADVGDYNGDGKDDILWRSDTGALSDWLGQANGGFVSNDGNALTNVPTNWHVQSPDSLWV